jgi:hypothetical protein
MVKEDLALLRPEGLPVLTMHRHRPSLQHHWDGYLGGYGGGGGGAAWGGGDTESAKEKDVAISCSICLKVRWRRRRQVRWRRRPRPWQQVWEKTVWGG